MGRIAENKRKWEREEGKGKRGRNELSRRIHVWMVHVLACMHTCVHTWAVAAAAEEGIVSLDYN